MARGLLLMGAIVLRRAITAVAGIVAVVGLLAWGLASRITPEQSEQQIQYANPPDYEEGVVSEQFGVREDNYSLGELTAPLTITVFCDVSDPSCQPFFRLLPEIVARYIKPGKVKIVWRDNPRSEDSADLVAALRVAALRDRFWEVAARLAEEGAGRLDRERLERILAQYGVKEPVPWEAADRLMETAANTAEAVGARGTNPVFYVGRQRIADDVNGLMTYLAAYDSQ